MQTYEDIFLIIPSLEPDEKLSTYIKALKSANIQNIIVVNDGSDVSYDAFFEQAKQDGCLVLEHTQNKGKGAALKTAYSYIKEHEPACKYIVTADSDGQHAVKDVLACIKAVKEKKNALVLGSRNFDLPHVPFKSRFGNKLTSVLFKLFYGQYVQDTQTGLRAFSIDYLDDMLQVEGNRFEYEMKVLIDFAKKKYPFEKVEIETIYDNKNAGTHFHPIKDSFKIYRVIFPKAFKFLLVSALTTLLDYLLFLSLFWLQITMHVSDTLSIDIASFTARFLSSLCNFLLNKNFVFNMENRESSKIGSSMIKYLILAIAIIVTSSNLTKLLHVNGVLNAPLAKPLVDALLFIVSYNIQRLWVFKK